MAKLLIVSAGDVFHWLTIIDEAEAKVYGPRSKARRFRVKCRCGTIKTLTLGELTSGHTKSCGCWKDMNTVARSTKHGLCSRTKEHPLYRVWCTMKNRCYNPSVREYRSYGARGITVCSEWRNDFARFLSDMGERPAGMSIDRIDNNKGYSKENCRWATSAEQGANKRNNVLITLNGATRTMAQWASISGINYHTLQTRYRAGKSPEEILSPVHRKLNLANKG